MKLLLQWSLATPQDWQAIDLTPTGKGQRAWRDLPRKPVPTGGETIDNTPGWLYDCAVQGIWLGGVDHISAEPVSGGGVRVSAWNDDPDDFPAGTRWARVMTFRPDFTQTKDYYVEPNAVVPPPHVHAGPNGVPYTVRFLPWSQFTPPSFAIHGIWLSDQLARQHAEVRRVPAYTEWV